MRSDGENQVTRFAYDANTRLRFTVEVLGAVSEKVYDAVGNVVMTMRFAVRPRLCSTRKARLTPRSTTTTPVTTCSTSRLTRPDGRASPSK